MTGRFVVIDRMTCQDEGLYSLEPVQSPAQWAAYHAIRRDAIFALLLPEQSYDENHPDEFKFGNLPHILNHGGELIGTVRIDLLNPTQAGLRLIGIRPDRQRQGHGRALLKLAERAVRDFGRTKVVINAHPTSLAFYLANGYSGGNWRDIGPVPAGLVRVGKKLTYLADAVLQVPDRQTDPTTLS
jgi:GNAT superfamily N-acetyltransferase